MISAWSNLRGTEDASGRERASAQLLVLSKNKMLWEDLWGEEGKADAKKKKKVCNELFP